MRAILFAVLLCASALPADSPAQALFDKAREKVVANVKKVPRYTCVETINRRQYRPQYGGRPTACTSLIEARAHASQGLLTWRDRLRLDVAVSDGSEIFSWAGATKFETNSIESLAAGGSSGSGAFSSFLTSVFGGDPDRFVYSGIENGLAVFEYRVPQDRSHYSYHMNNGNNRIIAYHGKFYLTSDTADLKRLQVEATDFADDDVCRVEDRMDYTAVRIGSGEFTMPEVSTMTVLYKSGDESVNETRFSGCHEYVGESTIRFGDEDDPEKSATSMAKKALQELPGRTRVRVRLQSPVDSDQAAAGDPVTGVVDRDSGPVHKGDLLHGRILRLEQYLAPLPYWVVAIRFDSIERDGAQQPVSLRARDDGDRSTAITRGRVRKVPLPTEPKDAGIFGFEQIGKLVLDERFRSEWEVVR